MTPDGLFKGLVNGLVCTLLSAGVMALSFLAWRLAYPGGMAPLVLVPLAAAVSIAHYRLYAGLYRARLDAELQDGTILRRILTGRVKALAATVALTAAAIAVAAFETLFSGLRELALLVLLCCASSAFYLILQPLMPAHYRPPYADVNSANLGALAGALPCMLLVYSMARSGHLPGDVRVDEFADWAMMRLEERIPRREGLLGRLLEPLIDLEKARAWLTGYIGGAGWVAAAYSVYGALVCLVLAKASVVCTMFFQGVPFGKAASAIRRNLPNRRTR